MTFDEFEAGAWRTFAGQDDAPREQLLAAALGLAGEVGEFVDLVKKACYHGHRLDISHATLELGDVLYSLAVASRVLGTTLEEVAIENQAKLQARYPDGFSVARSHHREKGAFA